MAKAPSKVSCKGVVFQFNVDAIVFEFSNGDEDEAIGIIKPKDLKIGPLGRCVLKDATTVEQMSKYLQVGDEVDCDVIKKEGLEEFTYFEEEEEIDEEGKVTNTKQEVSLQPKWLAESGKLVKGRTLDKEEIGELEQQLGEAFEKEITETAETKDPEVKKPARKRRKTPEVKKEEVKKIKDDKEVKEEVKKEVTKEVKKEKKVTVHEAKAVFAQLRKPGGLSWKNTPRVTTGTIKLLDGKQSGKFCNVSNGNMYVWGHHLANASLMNHIKHGDECIARYSVEDDETKQDLPPMIKKVWIGPITEKKVQAKDDKDFAIWLANRGLDSESFTKWISGEAPNKPYFPLIADIHEAEVIAVVRENGPEGGQGVVVRIGPVVKKNPLPLSTLEEEEAKIAKEASEKPKEVAKEIIDEKKDEGDEEIEMVLNFDLDNDLEDLMNEKPPADKKDADESLKPEGSLAILLPEDFYACSVSVGETDLRLLLRPGDKIHVQVSSMNAAVKRRFVKFKAARPDLKISFSANLGYLGSRPKAAGGDPNIADGLKTFLEEKGISFEEFLSMREGNNVFNPPKTLPPVASSTPDPDQKLGDVSNLAKVALATGIVSKVFSLQSENDPKIDSLFSSPEELDVAIELSKVLTMALIKQMQSKMRGKITQQLEKVTMASLNAQALQISAAGKALKGSLAKAPSGGNQPLLPQPINCNPAVAINPGPGLLPTPQSLFPTPVNVVPEKNLQSKLKEVEKKIADESAAKAKALSVGKKNAPSFDAKKILQSYREAKGVPEGVDIMTPLQYLRHYWKNELKIKMDRKNIIFGKKVFKRDLETDFKMSGSRKGDKEYYTLRELHLMMEKRLEDYEGYCRHCRVSSIRTVSRADRQDAIDYLFGRLDNPKQVKGSGRRRSSKEKDTWSKEDEAKAKLQMQMIGNPQQQQQISPLFNLNPVSAAPMMPAFQPTPASVWSGSNQGPDPAQRFDQDQGNSRLDYLYQRQQYGGQRGRSFSPNREGRGGEVLYDSARTRSRSPNQKFPDPIPIGSSRSNAAEYDPFFPTESPPGSPRRRHDLRMELEQRRWQEERDIMQNRDQHERLAQLERERDAAQRRAQEEEEKFRRHVEEERRMREAEDRRKRQEEEEQRRFAEEKRRREEEELRKTLEKERKKLEDERKRLDEEKRRRAIEDQRRQEEEKKRRQDLQEQQRIIEEIRKREERRIEEEKRMLQEEKLREEERRRKMQEQRRLELEQEEYMRKKARQTERERQIYLAQHQSRFPDRSSSGRNEAPVIDITDEDDDKGRSSSRRAPSPPRLSGNTFGFGNRSFESQWNNGSRSGSATRFEGENSSGNSRGLFPSASSGNSWVNTPGSMQSSMESPFSRPDNNSVSRNNQSGGSSWSQNPFFNSSDSSRNVWQNNSNNFSSGFNQQSSGNRW